MPKVTGIDIDAVSIKLVELDGSSRRPKITRTLSFPRSAPEQSEDPEVPTRSEYEQLIEDLKAAFAESGSTRERGVLVVPASTCILRNMTLPFHGKDEIRKTLKYEAEGQIHSHSIEDVVVDGLIVDERDEGTELFMVACPKEALDSDLKALQKSGIDPERAELSLLLLVEAARLLGVFDPAEGEDALPSELPEVVLEIGPTSIGIAIVRDGSIWTGRSLRWGLARVADDSGEVDGVVLAQRLVRELTRFLSGLGYGGDLGRVLLAGPGADTPGLAETLAHDAACPVERLALLERAGIEEEFGNDLDLAFAAGFSGLNGTQARLNFRQEELSYRPKFERLKLPLAVAVLALVVYVFGLAFNKYREVVNIEKQIAAVDTDKPAKRVSKKREVPHYHGLMSGILLPQKSGWLRAYVRNKADADDILVGAKKKDVTQRSRYVLKELKELREKLEKKTGYFPEIELESGVAVLQAFASFVDQASKDQGTGSFVITKIELMVGTRRKQGGTLKFTIHLRGEQDALRGHNASFRQYAERACGKDGPFESLVVAGEDFGKSSLDPSVKYDYTITLNDTIPVFQARTEVTR